MKPPTAVALVALLGAASGNAAAQKAIVTEPLPVLEARARSDSNDPAAHYNVAMGYLGARRFADAERELREAVAIDARFADAWLALSVVRDLDEPYWNGLRRAGGHSAVRRAVEAERRSAARAFLIDPLVDIRILGGTMHSSGEGPLSQAITALVEGRYDEAALMFDREIASRGRGSLEKVPPGLLWLGCLASSRAGKFDDAIAHLQELLSRFTREATKDSANATPLAANEHRYVIATLHQRAGRLDEATRLYREVLEHDVSNYMAHVQLARMHEAAKEWDAAVTERRRAADTDPEDASLVMDLGITLGRAGRLSEAVAALGRAAAANQRDARPWYWLGLAHLQGDRREDAKAAFTKFVALAPSRYERQLATARQRLEELK